MSRSTRVRLGPPHMSGCLSNAGYEKKNDKAYLILIIHYRTDPSTAECQEFFSSFLTEVGEEEIVMDWRSEGNEKVEAVGK